MNSNGSFLSTLIERIRGYVDAEESDKYNDAYIIRHLIQPSMADVLSRLNHNTDNPVLLRYSITLVQSQQFYQLPPCIQEVWRLAVINSDGVVTQESVPRDYFHPRGPGWEIQGNLLSIFPYPPTGNTLDLVYTSNGDVMCAYTTGTLAADLKTITGVLTPTPTLGEVDRRPNAYAGQMFRTLPSSATATREERVIESWDPSAAVGTLVLRRPLSYATAGAITFEVAPMALEALWEAVAARTAMKLGVYRNVSAPKMQGFKEEYLSSMKTIHDNLANFQARTGKQFHKGTVDNQGWYRL